MFEALLLTNCIRSIQAEGMKQVSVFVQVTELVMAFQLLTAIIVKYGCELSEDAWLILEELAVRVGAEPEDWHGLDTKRPNLK